MRNIPFPFISEDAVRATGNRERNPAVKSVIQRFVVALDRLTEMRGPNSIASLERAFRPVRTKRTDLR